VDGHPLKLVTCFIANTDAEGTTCGQQFAANKNVDVIATGGVAIGIQPFYTAIGTKTPVIDGVAVTGTDGVQPNAVILFGDATHVLARSVPTPRRYCTRRRRRWSTRTSRGSPRAPRRSRPGSRRPA